MGKRSSLLVLATALLLSSGIVQAADPKPGLGYFASLSAGASYGTLEGSGMQSRNLGVYGVTGDLGLTWGAFIIGAGLEYNLWRQMKDPAELNNTNAQGKEMSIAPTIGYNFKHVVLLARYYISSKYTLDKQNSSGDEVSFVKPSSSFAVEARIPFGSGRSYAGLNYKKMKYGSADIAGTEATIPSGSEVEASAFGASIGYGF